MRHTIILLTTVLMLFSFSVSSCSGRFEREMMENAGQVMESVPDSALAILSAIDKDKLRSKRDKARYALLMSMALDKNYIDTTDFSVIQPALDFYPKHGTPDEKLKTYYYQGRIFQNKGDGDNALRAFMNGLDMMRDCTDSLTLARTLVAQGILYLDFHDTDSYISSNLSAAGIYGRLRRAHLEMDCMLRVLNGYILNADKDGADSISSSIRNFKDIDEEQNALLQKYQLLYALKFGSDADVKELLNGDTGRYITGLDDLLTLASAQCRLNNHEETRQLLDYVAGYGLPYDTLKYRAITYYLLEDLGEYKEALAASRLFYHDLDSVNELKFEQKARSAAEMHRLEMTALREKQLKRQLLWGGTGCFAILVLIIAVLGLSIRSSLQKKAIAVREQQISASEQKRLALENKNLQLEKVNRELEAERLANRVEQLESECENLKNIIKQPLPPEVASAIKKRVEMLNTFLAGHISDHDRFEKSYLKQVDEITRNADDFMDSNRLAFSASHPDFIKHFEDHGLTDNEINYVCLYAIGLKGKEVGKYMNRPSHFNTSSAIRKKLGIDAHDTNLAIYVRNLLKQL